MPVLGTEEVIVEIGDPPAAGVGQIEKLYPFLQVHRHTVPEEARILLYEIGGRRITKLPIDTDLFEFSIQRVCLPAVLSS